MARGDLSHPGADPVTTSDAPADPLFTRAEARVGRTLDEKWRLDVLLGVGGTAAVYAATHRNGSRAAVKVLHPEASMNAFVRDRFLWEGYVANAVGHDAAVRVIDDDVAEDGSLFLVSELLDGETLEERRVRFGGRLSQSEVLLVVDQLLEMLAAAHAKSIVHRDLKPENVFLTRTGKIKVLDFGIARHGDGAPPPSALKGRTMVGTPAYMAPEHARGFFDELDARSDIWSCGAMMFRLLSGRGVHDEGTVEEEIASAMAEPAPPLAAVAPHVSEAVARVVDGALAFDREMRWSDARRMQAVLREAYHDAFGVPIASAEPIATGDGVPDRTLPRADALAVCAPWGPSSIRAVAISRHEPRPGRSGPAPHHKHLVGGLAFLALLATAVAWAAVERLASASAPKPTSIGTQTVACAQPPPVVHLSPLAPEVAADEPQAPPMLSPPPATVIPAAGFAPAVPPRWVPVARPAPSPVPAVTPTQSASAAPAPSPGKDCDPPFVVDWATGKQHWKLECL